MEIITMEKMSFREKNIGYHRNSPASLVSKHEKTITKVLRSVRLCPLAVALGLECHVISLIDFFPWSQQMHNIRP